MIKRINNYYPQTLFVILTLITGSLQVSADSQTKAIQDLVDNTMSTFQVPGVAIGIIKEGETYSWYCQPDLEYVSGSRCCHWYH